MTDILPAARAAGEDYATFDDIATAEDTPSCDVRVPWWKDREGRGRLMRVRGLSLTDEAAVERAGRIGAARYRKRHPEDTSPPASDWREEYIEVLLRGVVAPTLNRQQAEALLKKNARALDELVRFIRLLNRMDQEIIDNLVAAIVEDASRAQTTEQPAADDEPDAGDAPGDPDPDAEPSVDGGDPAGDDADEGGELDLDP